MAQSHSRLVPDHDVRAARHGKYKLDELDPARIAKHLVSFQPDEETIVNILATARLSIPGIADTEEVLKVARYNPFCVMALARKSKYDPAAPVAEGFVAALPLNALGLRLLALGSFNATSPDLRLLAKPDERPTGLYMWGVYAPGPLAAGIALFMERVSSPQYAGVSLYSRPNTEVGRRYNEVLGLTQGVTVDGIEAPNIWIFPRSPQTPLYDSYVPNSGVKNIGVTVARTFDDLMRVTAIRSAVYIGEQECPYDEEYDGNDLSATHLIVYIGDEPAGCLRARFFADFVKFERMAVRKEFRHTRALFVLCQAGLAYARKKGYRRAYAHSQIRLARIWQKLGFVPYEGSRKFVFSDFEYIEVAAELEPDPDALKIGTDPYLLIRPEGRWHKPGILENSVARSVTNPSVAKKR
ncbi:MAG TPA: GNAT family N-acetyltransferase [Rhizomicrobium sp.]|jgi:predicted GNAT family N-acyltransferase|nr:GNAT family N-acetyltransferase [Rhizomicrobium sp.]